MECGWIIVLCILVAGAAVLLFVPLKEHVRFRHVMVGLGVSLFVFDTVFLLCTCYHEKNNGMLLSVITAIQMISFGASYKEIFCALRQKDVAFIAFCIAMFLTPLPWAGFIGSLFPLARNQVRYWVRKKMVRTVYYFSDLNDNSLSLARSFFEKDRRMLYVFCDVNRQTDGLRAERAEEQGFVTFEKPITRYIKRRKSNVRRTYFFVAQNQDKNVDCARQVLQSYEDAEKRYRYKYGEQSERCKRSFNVTCYVYTEQESASKILAVGKHKKIPVHVINRNRFIAEDILFRHPLVESLDKEKKKHTAVIIGAGKVGTELIKVMSFVSQMGNKASASKYIGHQFKILVIDKQADQIRDSFFTEHTGLQNPWYDIQFEQADVLTQEFMSVLKQESKLSDTCYICVCLGDDDLNIRVAMFLRMYYMRKGYKENSPFIAVETKDDIKAAKVTELAEIDKKLNPVGRHESKLTESQSLGFHLHSFARDTAIYSERAIHSELECLALSVQFEYEKVRAKFLGEEPPTKSVVEESYYLNENTMRSARARALHIPVKLFCLGRTVYFSDGLEKAKNVVLSQREDIEKSLQDEGLLNELAEIEHDRWVAYMRSEGWTKGKFTLRQLQSGRYRRIREKFHWCIQPLAKIKASKKVNRDFELYDIQMVKSLIQIIEGADAFKSEASDLKTEDKK